MRYQVNYDILTKDTKIDREFSKIVDADSKCSAIDKMIENEFGECFFFLQTFEFSGIGKYGAIFEKDKFPNNVKNSPLCRICINAYEIKEKS